MTTPRLQHDERSHQPHWLRGFGAWSLDELHADEAAWLLALRRKAPVVYHFMRKRQAFVLADREGNVFELRMSCLPIEDADLAFLADLPHLKSLQLKNCQRVTDNTLKYLTDTKRLETLDVDGTLISGFGLRSLRGHQELEALTMDFTRVGTMTADDLETVPEDEPDAKEILRTYGLSYLKSFPKLRKLSLLTPDLGDRSLAGVAEAKALQKLSIYGEYVTEKGLRHLYGHPQLKYLHLEVPSITTAQIKQLQLHLPPDCVVIPP